MTIGYAVSLVPVLLIIISLIAAILLAYPLHKNKRIADEMDKR